MGQVKIEFCSSFAVEPWIGAANWSLNSARIKVVGCGKKDDLKRTVRVNKRSCAGTTSWPSAVTSQSSHTYTFVYPDGFVHCSQSLFSHIYSRPKGHHKELDEKWPSKPRTVAGYCRGIWKNVLSSLGSEQGPTNKAGENGLYTKENMCNVLSWPK